MNTHRGRRVYRFFVLAGLLLGVAFARAADDRLIGTWTVDEGYQILEILFRSDGRYQLDTRSTDPFGSAFTERGYYETVGNSLILTSYDQFGPPEGITYQYSVSGTVFTMIREEFSIHREFQYIPGSREDVLARESVPQVLIGSWTRHIQFWGTARYTFRPGGYYFVTDTPEDGQFPPEYTRGRYTNDPNAGTIIIHPYSGIPAVYEADFFGTNLTLIMDDGSSSRSETYDLVPGSVAEVTAKSAEAEAFLNSANWQAGIWEIRDGYQTTDLTIRPDGYYSATNASGILRGMVRGRYTLEPRRIHLFPFVGQGIYSPDNGEFGKVNRTREIDYYDGELQFIDLTALSQWVTIATKRAGSQALVMQKTQEAHAQRATPGWQVGIWEVNDPSGWMAFTFRPDDRYIAQEGSGGVPFSVERGRYKFASEKVTLAPYSGLGPSRGFDLDLYDGNLFLIGDTYRMVIARKLAGSETEVNQKTTEPDAMKGERGSVFGRWSANMPGQNVELVFRQDGHFRLQRCANNATTFDYGLYSANMASRGLVYDSRFTPVENRGLDFYGNTLTIFGGLSAPSTYKVNLGSVDNDIAASHAADAAEAVVDAQWLARVPIGPRDPGAVQVPGGGIPADPNPGLIFSSPTVFNNYQLYRRLIPGFVYWNDGTTIRSAAVTHTREWHFFATGRVIARFRNYFAGAFWPTTYALTNDSWGAYRIEPKPTAQDILHAFADNSLFIQTDLGEQAEMTLEDGRRHLFWGKDYMLQYEWAAEQQTIPCQLPANPDPTLINSGVLLSTTIPPDNIGVSGPFPITLTSDSGGNLAIGGALDVDASLIVERTDALAPAATWLPVHTNNATAGTFNMVIPKGTNAAGYFRVRMQ